MTRNELTRASAVASVLFGALVAASAIQRLAGTDPVTAAWLAFAGVTFGLVALVGLHAHAAAAAGRLGSVAFAVAIGGCALSLGQLYGLTFNEPRTGPLGPLFPLGYGPFLFGMLLFDVVLIRTNVLPRAAAALLIAGAVLNAAGFATADVRLLGVIVFGAGAVWLGDALWAAATMPTARVDVVA